MRMATKNRDFIKAMTQYRLDEQILNDMGEGL